MEQKLTAVFTAQIQDLINKVKLVKKEMLLFKGTTKNLKMSTDIDKSVDKTKEKMQELTNSVKTYKKTITGVGKHAKNLQPNIAKPNAEQKQDNITIGELVGVTALVKGTSALFKFGMEAISTTARINASVGQMNFIFKENKKVMLDWINNNSNALGISQNAMIKYANLYGNVLKNIEKDSDATTKRTQQFLQITSLLSQKTGYDMQTTAEAIRSGLLGETESIDKLGIEVKAKVLQTTEAFKQIAKGRSWEKLEYKEQQQIIMMGILEQASKNFGTNFEQNMQASLNSTSANIEDAKDNFMSFLGDGLLPFATIGNTISQILLNITQMVKGLDKETATFIVTSLAVVSTIPLSIIGFTVLGGVITKVKAQVMALTGASKALQFVMSKGFLGTVGIIIVAISVMSATFGGISNVIKSFGSVVQATFIYIGGSIIRTVGTIINAIARLFNSTSTAGQSFIQKGNEMIQTASGIATKVRQQGQAQGEVKAGSDKAVKGLNNSTSANKKNADSAKKAAKAAKELKDNLQGFDEINKLDTDKGTAGDIDTNPISGNIPDIKAPSMAGFDAMKNPIQGVLDKLKELKNFLPELTVAGLLFIGAVFGNPMIWSFSLAISGIILMIKGIMEYFQSPTWENFGVILGGIALLATGIGLAFGLTAGLIVAAVGLIVLIVVQIVKNWDKVVWAFQQGGKLVSEFFKWLGSEISKKFTEAWEGIKQAWNNSINFFKWIGEMISTAIKLLITYIIGIFLQGYQSVKNTWNNIVGFFRWIWDGIVGIFSGVGGFFSDKFTQAVNGIKNVFLGLTWFFRGVWSGITGIFTSIGTSIGNAVGGAFKGVVNSVIGFAQGTINTFIRGINGAISVINAIPGVNIPRIGSLYIPRMATGGVVTSSTLANIGEGKYNEAVIPLGQSPQFRSMKEDIAQAVIDGLNAKGTSGGNRELGQYKKIEVDLSFGGIPLAKKLIELQDENGEYIYG